MKTGKEELIINVLVLQVNSPGGRPYTFSIEKTDKNMAILKRKDPSYIMAYLETLKKQGLMPQGESTRQKQNTPKTSETPTKKQNSVDVEQYNQYVERYDPNMEEEHNLGQETNMSEDDYNMESEHLIDQGIIVIDDEAIGPQRKQMSTLNTVKPTILKLTPVKSSSNNRQNVATEKTVRRVEHICDDETLIYNVEHRILEEVFKRPPLFNWKLAFRHRTPNLQRKLRIDVSNIIYDEMGVAIDSEIVENTFNHFHALYTVFTSKSILTIGSRSNNLPPLPQHFDVLRQLQLVRNMEQIDHSEEEDNLDKEDNMGKDCNMVQEDLIAQGITVVSEENIGLKGKRKSTLKTVKPKTVKSLSKNQQNVATKKGVRRVEHMYDDEMLVYNVERHIIEEVLKRPPLFNYKLAIKDRTPDLLRKLLIDVSDIVSDEMEVMIDSEIVENTFKHYRALYTEFTNKSDLPSGSGSNKLPPLPKHFDVLRQLQFVQNKREQVSSLSPEGFLLQPPKNKNQKKDVEITTFLNTANNVLSTFSRSSIDREEPSPLFSLSNLIDTDPDLAFFLTILPDFKALTKKDRRSFKYKLLGDLNDYHDRYEDEDHRISTL